MQTCLPTVAALAALLFVLPTPTLALDNPVLIDLAGSSGRIGTATFFQSGDRVLVNVEFSNVHLEGMQLEIDQGRCGNLQGLETELTKTVNGQSQTDIGSTTLATLVDRPHALVLRRSAWTPPVACGNITG